MSRSNGERREARADGPPAPVSEREWLGRRALAGTELGAPGEPACPWSEMGGVLFLPPELPSGDVLAYLSQCDCGQQALTRSPHPAGWTCPTCDELIRSAEEEAQTWRAINDYRAAEEAAPVVHIKTWLPGDPAWGDVDVAAGERVPDEYDNEEE